MVQITFIPFVFLVPVNYLMARNAGYHIYLCMEFHHELALIRVVGLIFADHKIPHTIIT